MILIIIYSTPVLTNIKSNTFYENITEILFWLWIPESRIPTNSFNSVIQTPKSRIPY